MSELIKIKKLENKVAIVTGGASGIGEETARRFAQHGAKVVVIADVQEEKGRQVAESIGQNCCTFIKCDVSNEDQVKSLVDFTINTYGQLDIMFSNAGIIPKSKQDILDFDINSYENVFAVNVRGMILCVKHAGHAMVNCGIKGSIICTGSSTSTIGVPSPIDYVMSKHAVVGLVMCASKGLGEYGIRVNCVSPALLATSLGCQGVNKSPEEVEKSFEDLSCLKKIGPLKVKHVADAVLFLASDDSEFITGINLAVDGNRRNPA